MSESVTPSWSMISAAKASGPNGVDDVRMELASQTVGSSVRLGGGTPLPGRLAVACQRGAFLGIAPRPRDQRDGRGGVHDACRLRKASRCWRVMMRRRPTLR